MTGYRRFGRLFEGSGRFGSGVGGGYERFRRFLVSFGGGRGGSDGGPGEDFRSLNE